MMLSQAFPFVLRFKRPIALQGVDPFTEPGAKFDNSRALWVDRDGTPLYAAASKPYTSVYTAAHTIKGGWTPSGKYKPTRIAPGKMDKRSGK
jgi:hypothetical protein